MSHDLRPLEAPLAEDCETQGKVDSWLALHEGLFCGQDAVRNKSRLDPRCLERDLGSTRVALDAEENKIRGRETNLGDWVADRMVEAFAACGAQKLGERLEIDACTQPLPDEEALQWSKEWVGLL